MPTILLSRETSPHTNRVFTGVLPSRETGPHTNHTMKRLAEALKRSAKIPERCEECSGEHLTRICIKRFQKLQKPKATPLPASDNDSTGSDTLYDSEESESDKSTTDQLTPPTKMVTFDLLKEETKDPVDEAMREIDK